MFTSAQSARPDWLWSGVGFRLDDRVYREDRVTQFLRQQWTFPSCTLTDSAIPFSWPPSPPPFDTPSLPFIFLSLSSLLSSCLFSFASIHWLLKWNDFSLLWVLLTFVTCLPLGPVWAGWADWNHRVPGVGLVEAPPLPAPALLTQRPVSWCFRTIGDRWDTPLLLNLVNTHFTLHAWSECPVFLITVPKSCSDPCLKVVIFFSLFGHEFII